MKDQTQRRRANRAGRHPWAGMLLTLFAGAFFALTLLIPQVARAAGTKEMYRLYNSATGEHFYTADANERDTLVRRGWKNEGVAWTAPEISSTPVYRLYNPYTGDHHYTTAVSERDGLSAAGWRYEGIGWYSSDAQAVPLYRLYNPNARGAGSHHYTTNAAERDSLVAVGWKDEGTGWYGTQSGAADAAQGSGAVHTPGMDTVQRVSDWEMLSGSGTRRDSADTIVADVSAGKMFYVKRTFELQPHTEYRLCASMRFGHGVQIADGAQSGGLSIVYQWQGESWTYGTDFYANTDWTERYYSFNSGEHTSITLYFYVNRLGADNTVYIKDIVLNELEMSNEWDVLAIIYTDVSLASSGFRNSFSDTDVADIKDMLSELPDSFYYRSGGRMKIRTLDVVVDHTPITSATGTGLKGNLTYGPGKDLNFDAYLEGHDYNQVILFAPLNGYAEDWLGLGGSTYVYQGRTIYHCIVNDNTRRSIGNTTVEIDGRTYNTEGHAIYHEVLHCVETNSRRNGWEGFAILHSVEEHGYGYAPDGTKLTGLKWESEVTIWDTDLMQDRIRDGSRGFVPESFRVSHLRKGQ